MVPFVNRLLRSVFVRYVSKKFDVYEYSFKVIRVCASCVGSVKVMTGHNLICAYLCWYLCRRKVCVFPFFCVCE